MVLATIDVQDGIAGAQAMHFGARLIRDRRPETYQVLNGTLPVRVDA
jgi:hypothetical protein